ncbi:hypothetical protein ACH4DZ_44995, partial [Streptomyces sp. NPDC017991]
MGGAIAKADEGGQQSIDQDRFVFRPGTNGPATGSCPQVGWRVGLFVVRRHELTDQAWAVIEPLLAPSRMGRPV